MENKTILLGVYHFEEGNLFCSGSDLPTLILGMVDQELITVDTFLYIYQEDREEFKDSLTTSSDGFYLGDVIGDLSVKEYILHLSYGHGWQWLADSLIDFEFMEVPYVE